MALLLSYGRAAVALVFLASFSAALISLLLVVPSVTVFLSDLPYALGYAIVHTLIFYVAAWSMTRLAGGFMRFEQISHVFIVIYGSLFASALSSLATTALFAAESAMDPFPWLDHFVLRWMASLTGVLCFALTVIPQLIPEFK